jgi:acetylglutamate kinase
MRLVIKFAGALLEDAAAVQSLSQHIAALAQHDHEVLVIHGGGRLFTATLKRLGIESKFVSGLRMTDRETRDVAVMVFGGLLNKRLAAAITAAGQPAIGISASDGDSFSASPLVHNDVEGSLGFVGYLTSVNLPFLQSLWREKLVPVAACLGQGPGGELYNINADHMAAASAEFIAADHLIYLTDVAGVLQNEQVISVISTEQIEVLVHSRVVSGGMVLKLEAAKRALEGGVREVHIVGGESAGAILDPRLFSTVSSKTCNPDLPGTRVLRAASSATYVSPVFS